jgi:2-C-methyl-D-erythritol 4-phosphate cytidylyltransferase/2-C-methyl-D-erythritol 2,4-cyclodiphosphate synthase
MREVRIGQGFDVHRYRSGRLLRLCGVELEGEIGLDGHSDADVGLHAVTDALLGAVAAGDIGEHFPPSDSRWRDADSRIFLAAAIDEATSRGFDVVNCDVTIIGERPRVGPYRDRLRHSLAELLGVDVGRVSVKATTSEGLGFTGRLEGLAALAVVLVGQRSA